MKAIWNGKVIAESEATIIVENNHYFPTKSVNPEYMKGSATTSLCPWKGSTSYDHVVVDGSSADDAAWHISNPTDAAENLGIKDYYAFWNGVEVVE